MLATIKSLALLGVILSLSLSTVTAEVNIQPDTPRNQLITSAKAARARGLTNDALTYFDAAIAKDGSDYVTIFQRGATYLAAGKNAQARADFDTVLSLKPDFESALLQRAKIFARNAEWQNARQDYQAAGAKGAAEITTLDEAEGASYLASEASSKQDWDACINQAGIAIMVASTSLPLRQLRAHCRFESGDVQMGVSDLQHVLQINPFTIEPHLQIAAMQFYLLGDTTAGLTQVKTCLHSDPDSKPCKLLFREFKSLSKSLTHIDTLISTRKFTAAVRELTDQPPTASNPDPTPASSPKSPTPSPRTPLTTSSPLPSPPPSLPPTSPTPATPT
jgi:DnaJ homolog subfamily C member 3